MFRQRLEDRDSGEHSHTQTQVGDRFSVSPHLYFPCNIAMKV